MFDSLDHIIPLFGTFFFFLFLLVGLPALVTGDPCVFFSLTYLLQVWAEKKSGGRVYEVLKTAQSQSALQEKKQDENEMKQPFIREFEQGLYITLI